jgi:phosphopantothenoylcysteine decarboxylase/phosphopantothenate--cysteine ligase
MKVLITSGATREPIDGVRFITNFSSGTTGAMLADSYHAAGYQVIYLHGIGATMPKSPCSGVSFESFRDLNSKLKLILSEHRFSLIVHLAAISDYSVDQVILDGYAHDPHTLTKINSDSEISIKLKRNFKLINSLTSYSAPHKPVIVGFKLTNTNSIPERQNAIQKLASNPDIDIIVHNDLTEIKAHKYRRFYIYRRGRRIAECSSRIQFAQKIIDITKQQVSIASARIGTQPKRFSYDINP